MKFTIKKSILIILILCSTSIYAHTIKIDDKTTFYDLLPSSEIYIDKTRKLTIDDLKNSNIQFIKNDKSILSYGYSPDFDVWIKFTIKNTSNKNIDKILEYENSMSTNINLYDIQNNTIRKDGLLYTPSSRNSINPIFTIELKPQEAKTYYIKASSYITTLIIKLSIYDNNIFYTKEIKHQIILSIFFGAMLILAIYNAFIYFFTKDISYLYYVLYILSISLHHTLYVGMANLYIIDNQTMHRVVQFASVFLALPIFFLALFSKSFLQINKYPILDKIMNILLSILPLYLLVFLFTDSFNAYRNIFILIILLYLIAITIYLVFKKNRQAYFIIFGWFILTIGTFTMYLSSAGIINIYNSFPYIVELSLLLEAILFSIALSDKINILQEEKNTVNKQLINQKKTENERLEIQVKEKTIALNTSLEQKNVLLQEINHRVKNNMQMIVSLIRLQINDIEEEEIQSLFLTTQNRLNAMSHLHELLYQTEDILYVNAYEYFISIIESLQETYTQKVHINYQINTDLQTEQAISCGMILNELITNSLKYAFNDDQANNKIDISLLKANNNYTLIVKDNGVGYDKVKIVNSFGLILVDTLSESKLQGNITSHTINGVETKIIWREI